MTNVTADVVSRWSTNEVESAMRLDYYAHALSTALTPMLLMAADARTFDSQMTAVHAGPLAVIRQSGSAHRVRRDPSAGDRVAGHAWHLMANLSAAWNTHQRQPLRLLPGEMILMDSRMDFMVELAGRYEVAHVKLSPAWLRRWVPLPEALAGRRISAASGWGRVLAAYLAQLSPQVFVASPLPASVLADQIGALLALVAGEQRPGAAPPGRRDDALYRRVRDGIVLRCTESGITAAEIAAELGISVRTLHRTLAAFNETFGKLLIDSRAAVALQMIRSGLCRRLSLAEIGRRAGFADSSHFSRVMSSRYGRAPSQLRAPAPRGDDGETALPR